ncbi:MAG: DUF2933 domain-containing protein [Pseudomonadota bacterium]|jgi:hypothetical protein
MNTPGHDRHTAHAPREDGARPARSWQVRVGFWLLLGIAAFYLVTEHRSHTLGAMRWLPLLILLACPLLHVWMHRGHRHGPGARGGENPHDRHDGTRG